MDKQLKVIIPEISEHKKGSTQTFSTCGNVWALDVWHEKNTKYCRLKKKAAMSRCRFTVDYAVM